MKLLCLLVLMVSVIFLGGCYYDTQEELHPAGTNQVNACDTSVVTYTSKILPILQSKCYSCHNSASHLGGVDLENFTSLQNFIQSGQLYGSVSYNPNYIAMPQGMTKLSDCEIAYFRVWIKNGAVNN